MRNCFFIIFCLCLSSGRGVVGEDEHIVKKGTFPYMAFIYYSDPSVLDASGARFIRSAVLIRTDWLITSALGASVLDNGFPKKTLQARVGAVAIDGNFTLNEDEDEQEQEVIQIVRPYNHSATQWWMTDISLVKTLLPFNKTPVVNIKTINLKRDSEQKTCSILVYAKLPNSTDDKVLMELFVEMLPPVMEKCGSHFSGITMMCAADSDDNKEAAYEPDFCQGNSGGPLICGGEVTGLQTYISNDCAAPHLYQLLSSWDNFITCGIENKCHEEQCGNICDVTYKDTPSTEPTPKIVIKVNDFATEVANTPSPTVLTTSAPVTETMRMEEFAATSTFIVTETTTVGPESTSTVTIMMEEREIVTETTSTTTESVTTQAGYTDTTETVPWPKEKMEGKEGTMLAGVPEERKASVEAHQEGKKKRNAAEMNMCFVQTVFFGLVLKCLF